MKSFEVRNNGRQVVDMYGVVFTKKGNIAVTVYGGSCILIYSKEGTHIRTIALKGDTRGLAVDQKGNLYVCIELKCLVCIYTEEGKLKLQFGSKGKGKGKFETPYDIAVGMNGLIYVCDHSNMRIQVFNGEGKYAYHLETKQLCFQLCVSHDGYLIIEEERGTVSVYKDTTFVHKWTYKTAASSVVPAGIAVNKKGSVYIANWDSGIYLF